LGDNQAISVNSFLENGRMDRLQAMRLLIEVSDCGSFSRASQTLNVPLSTLSRRITELEEHVGTKFLVRTTRKIALTEAGRNYIEACRDILEQVDAAEQAAAGEFTIPKGSLLLTSPIMFGQQLLVPVIQEFLERYSHISVHLTLSDRNAQIVEEGFDLAVRVGQLPDSSMSAVRLGDTRRVICASPAVLEAHGVPKHPDDLLELPCVAHDFRVSATSWSFADKGRKGERRVIVDPRLSVSTAEAAVEAAIRGAGFARLFYYQAADALGRGELCVVLDQFEREPNPISFLHPSGRAVPAKVRSFLDFAAPKLRTKLVGLASIKSPAPYVIDASNEAPPV
jgi:DNA-binding transcriptional LysR family regulator